MARKGPVALGGGRCSVSGCRGEGVFSQGAASRKRVMGGLVTCDTPMTGWEPSSSLGSPRRTPPHLAPRPTPWRLQALDP